MKKSIYLLFVLGIFLFSCNSNKKNHELLNSSQKNDLIEGAIKAGNSGREEYIPLLLQNCNNYETSTNLKFKGISVYQAKMQALQKIFRQNPPNAITDIPDSSVIKFYTSLYKKRK